MHKGNASALYRSLVVGFAQKPRLENPVFSLQAEAQTHVWKIYRIVYCINQATLIIDCRIQYMS